MFLVPVQIICDTLSVLILPGLYVLKNVHVSLPAFERGRSV